MRLVASLVGCIAIAGCAPPETVARADFQAYCAGCHGADARGGGAEAPGMTTQPPDLTRISARNDGVFPRVRVMSVIDGYGRADQHGAMMPEFGPLLQGDTVLIETDPGVMTPTPIRLAALADWLEQVQRD